MTFQRIATVVLFVAFLGLSLLELVPKWQAAAHKGTNSVMFVRSFKQPAPPILEKKAVNYESILKANSKNKDG